VKFKDIILPFIFVFASTLFIQKFFLDTGKSEEALEVKAGKSFKVPSKAQLMQPLVTEVDFQDSDIPCAIKEQVVETEKIRARFSSCGAAIFDLSYKRMLDGKPGALTTVDVQPEQGREKLAFLVALNQRTPLNYELVNEKHEQGVHTLLFRSNGETCSIEKEFVFYDNSYKIDCKITIDPRGKSEIQPRIFLPGPFLKEADRANVSRAIIFNERDVLEKINTNNLEGRAWVIPSLFGAEDRYFVQAMVADTDGFVQRAYYKMQGAQSLTAILEGPIVTEKKTWNLSFYCGPKELAEMTPVDPRLGGIMEYGIFGPLSKFLMKALNFIYGYVYNYGLAIILLTLLIKLLLLPFSMKAEKGQKKLGEMQKKMKYLEKKYQDDPERLKQEKAELVSKDGVSGMLGCLPMFAQIPIFFGLSRALTSSIELYRAPFFGWITDLSASDPYYIFPILAGLGLFLETSRGTTASGNPRQKFVNVLMALFLAGVMSNISVGLVLFVCLNVWFGFAQKQIQRALKI